MKTKYEIYYDREKTKPVRDYKVDDNGYAIIQTGTWYVCGKTRVLAFGDSKVYAYGEGVHIEAYGNSCVTLFNGAVATLHDESMLMLDHNDPNNGYSEDGFRVYRDLRDEGMVGSFMYKWGSDTMLCKYPKWAASPIWDSDWLWEHESHLYVAFRGCSHLFSYSSFKTKTLFEHESNEDTGFKVRLRDMTDQEYEERYSCLNEAKKRHDEIITKIIRREAINEN